MGVYIPAADKLTTELQTEIADLRQVDPRIGLFRFATIGAIVLSLTALAWSASDIRAFVGITAITGIFYAFWMLCSHDMVHQTLTGWSCVPRYSIRSIACSIRADSGGFTTARFATDGSR